MHVELKKETVKIQEFFDSLVIIYQNGAVATYACSHEHSQAASVSNMPVILESIHKTVETIRFLPVPGV